MSYDTVHKILRSRMKLQITDGGDGGAALVTQFPNLEIDTPNNTSWADFRIIPTDRRRITVGGGGKGRYRYRGVARIVLRTPAAKGDSPVLELVDRIETVFRSETLSDSGVTVVLRTPRLNGEPVVVQPWFTATVDCPFYSDLIVT